MTALDAYEDVVIDRDGRVDVCGKLTGGDVQRFAVRQLDDDFTELWTYTTDAGQDGGAAYELTVDARGRPCALGVIPLLDWATPRDAPSLVALDADGAERWIYRHPGDLPGDSYLWSLARYRSSNVYACGMQPNASGGYDAALFGWGL
jgi:outer membrane protein assembly factor BamB